MSITFRYIGHLGRLGNQMFQLASAIGIAEKNGFKAVIPLENCLNLNQTGPIDPSTGTNTLVKCDILDGFEIPSDLVKPSVNIAPAQMYQENDFRYNPQVENLPDNTDLYGYFQNEKYFSNCSDKIRSVFTFKKEIQERANTYWDANIKPNLKGAEITVSVHVRRGDYVMYPDHHPTCSKEYYDKAISEFNPTYNFLVFSDDTEWCRNEFNEDNFIIVDTKDQFMDMFLMSQCHHNIIANSSFSWWAAWLNKNMFKTVIAPSKWFGPAIPKDTSEVYCQGWKVI